MGAHDLILMIEEVLGGINLPACISLVDNDGLIIHSVGECVDQWLLENLNAHLIMSYESTMEKLKGLNEVLDSLVIHTGDKVFYVDDIRGVGGLFIIVQTSSELMDKVLPFLKNFVKKFEMTMKNT